MVDSSDLYTFDTKSELMESNIGEKIRKIRDLKGFSQEYMASKLGFSQRAYSKMERNETKLDWKKITDISKVLGVEPIDLISFDDNFIFHNCTQSGKFGIFNNQIPDKLITQYEKWIKSLEDEIAFLRKLLEAK